MIKVLLCLLITLIPQPCISYEVNVHETISEHAMSSSNVKSYMLNNLGVSSEDTFKADMIFSKTAIEWIKAGSNWEDNTFDGLSLVARYLNHFFDPTTGMGLHDEFTSKPSKQWGYLDLGNDFSWRWARSKYYTALADSDPNLRAKAFAHVFRSLGQIMHLVHDKAVPAHVRNDAHNPFANYFVQQRYV